MRLEGATKIQMSNGTHYIYDGRLVFGAGQLLALPHQEPDRQCEQEHGDLNLFWGGLHKLFILLFGFGFPKIPVTTGTTAEHPLILSKIDRGYLKILCFRPII